MQDFLGQLDTKMLDLEAWKNTEAAREKLSALDAGFGRYLLLLKIAMWGVVALAAFVTACLSWWFLAGASQLVGIGLAAMATGYAMLKADWAVARPPKASAIMIQEVEKRVAPAKVMLWLARILMPKIGAKRTATNGRDHAA